MIKMFKAFNSYEMMVDIEPGFNEHEFTDNVKELLNKYRAKDSERMDLE